MTRWNPAWLALVCALSGVAPASAAAPSRRAATDAPGEAAARTLLARPKGSLSLGTTGGGRLIEAALLKPKGAGYAIFPHMVARDTRFGTRELVALLPRVAGQVARRYPGSVLGVGNLGFRDGGRIPWSVSHQAGRDADIGMFARERVGGRQVELRQFVAFGPDGLSRDRRYRFDAGRNLELVRALVEDEVGVQYVFVAEWLKRLILAEAVSTKVPASVVGRLEQVLHQPSDSNPHADHFHVRIFCSVEDRLEGCRNIGPARAWVDLGDGPWATRVEALARVVREVRAPKLRRQAIARIAELRGTPALPTLFDALADTHDDIRTEALRAIRALEAPGATAGLLSALEEVRDPRWAAKLFDAALASNDPGTVPVALRAATAPTELLHPDARGGATAPVQRAACRILGRFGREDAAAALLPLLEAAQAEVRQAAHDALLQVTNQRITGVGLRSANAKQRDRTVAAWHAFWDREREAGWLAWMRRGFEARGLRFPGKMASRAGVEVLIKAIGAKDRLVSDNAVRTLGELTGHVVDPIWRTPRNNQRHWRSWWTEHGASVALP